MKSVVQRVSSAAVHIDGREVARIGSGLLALVGIERGDTAGDARATAAKLAALRVFRDPSDPRRPIERGLPEVGGQCLVISQFTIPGRVARGRRPGFDRAEEPSRAEALYTLVVEELRRLGIPTQTGRFAADMQVELVNDGPVTILVFARGGKVVDPE